MQLSDTYANATLDLVLGSGHGSTFPATVYVGLATAAPTTNGTPPAEPTGGGYARVSVPNDTAHWGAASGRAKTNAAQIAFPTVSGTPYSASCGYWFIADAATAGTVITGGALSAAFTGAVGDSAVMAAGALTITVPTT